MPEIYVSGHSGPTEFTTFVPAGTTVHFYAWDGFFLPEYAARVLLSGGHIDPLDTFEAGFEIPNHEIDPLHSCERAHQVAYEADPRVRSVLTVEEPTELCTADCTPETGHTCDGIFGRGDEVVHLVICRGDRADYAAYPGLEELDREIDEFMAMDAGLREFAWQTLCTADPDKRDDYLTDRRVSAWVGAACVWDYARHRDSQFAIARYMGALEPSCTHLILASAAVEQSCADLAEAYEREMTEAREFTEGIGWPRLSEVLWNRLTPHSCEDLLAIEQEGIGDAVRCWLASAGQGVWEHGLENATWQQTDTEPVVMFRGEFYAVLDDTGEPLWPACRDEPWCRVAYGPGDAAVLVRLGTEVTPRRRQLRDRHGTVSYVPLGQPV